MVHLVSALVLAPEVRHALDAGRPLVALETTVVTHGLPSPDGLELAARIEEAVRAAGACPATIGVLEGQVRIGLAPPELERLAGARPEKLNPGNLATCLAAGGNGSTTVAATVVLAHRAGIRVVATGGIGGVHRDVHQTGDVSADLVALARFPVAVVCSGAKAVLDLPRTVEALETLQVPVLGFATDRFPAFYRRDGGCPVDRRFDAVDVLAAAVDLHLESGIGSGVLVANPVAPEDELPAKVYDEAIGQALDDARRAGVRGRSLTPFLLERLRILTGGASVATNAALLLGNARLAGALAGALSRRRRSEA